MVEAVCQVNIITVHIKVYWVATRFTYHISF
jgi:hypothetical protein